MPNEGGFETRPYKNHQRSATLRPRFGVRLAHMRLPCPHAGERREGDSLAFVENPRRLDACFEFFCERSKRQYDDFRADLERAPDYVQKIAGRGLRIASALDLDEQAQRILASNGHRFAFEIVDHALAKQKVLELRVSDVHPLDLEEPAGAMRVADDRKDREWAIAARAGLAGNEIS